MYNTKSNELENEVIKVLGEKCHFAITLIRAGNAGYFARIEANGFPFTVRSFETTIEKAEELAIEEFKRKMSEALEKDMFHSQPEEKYWEVEVLKEDADKLYDDTDIFPLEFLNQVKENTTIKMCKLENGNYECVIDCNDLRIHVRNESPSKRLAKAFAIFKARHVISPELVIVGDRPHVEEN